MNLKSLYEGLNSRATEAVIAVQAVLGAAVGLDVLELSGQQMALIVLATSAVLGFVFNRKVSTEPDAE